MRTRKTKHGEKLDRGKYNSFRTQAHNSYYMRFESSLKFPVSRGVYAFKGCNLRYQAPGR